MSVFGSKSFLMSWHVSLLNHFFTCNSLTVPIKIRKWRRFVVHTKRFDFNKTNIKFNIQNTGIDSLLTFLLFFIDKSIFTLSFNLSGVIVECDAVLSCLQRCRTYAAGSLPLVYWMLKYPWCTALLGYFLFRWTRFGCLWIRALMERSKWIEYNNWMCRVQIIYVLKVTYFQYGGRRKT